MMTFNPFSGTFSRRLMVSGDNRKEERTMTITVKQLAQEFDRINSGDYERRTFCYACTKCAAEIRKDSRRGFIGDLVHDKADNIECDICGKVDDLWECVS